MKVIRGINNVARPAGGSVVAVGVFDGVHIGHARLIGKVVRRSHELGCKSIVVTFEPHPAKLLRRDEYTPTLIATAHKIRLIGELGVDILVILKFSRAFSRLTPSRFIRNIIVGGLNAREIYASPKFYFGRGGRAGIAELRRIAAPYGIRVHIIAPAKVSGTVVGSSRIRRLILRGDLETAARFLGRDVSVLGTVVAGSRFGRTLGYPTANINPHHEVVPPSGVYAVMIRLNGKDYKGVLNIGTRPTFYSPRDSEPTIEAHIFGFKGDIYGRDVEVFFKEKIRDEIRYKDRDALIERIRMDCRLALKIL